jgi:SpoVK/Ycf46/Vps4 family AAA+-type ATPase
LKESLRKCILTKKPDVSFEDIAGNEYAKEVINTSFVLPNIFPQVFKKNKVRPW